MSYPPPPVSPGPPNPYGPPGPSVAPRRLGRAALIGGVAGIVGPPLLLLASIAVWQLVNRSSAQDAGIGLLFWGIVLVPGAAFIIGLVTIIIERTRAWGVALLVFSGTWLISTAGTCVVALIVGAAGMK